MSWKGFQKSVVRAPQTVKQRFNVGEVSKDPVYIDAERRFQELESETKKLHDESKKYFDAINSMLSHQIEFSKACAEIYKPISGRVSDPDSFVQDGNPEGIRACEEYEAIVKDLQETLAPELEMIESRVIKPADELLEIIKMVRKTAAKRDHKQLDYDRHRATLKKLQDKKDRTLKDEKALYKAENDVELATQDYNHFNELLKTELPELFRLEREFIRPLFQSFYYMQLNVFYTLHERMQSIDIGYFNLDTDIEGAFEEKRGEIAAQVEQLSIVKFKTTGGRPKGVSKYGNKPLAIEPSKYGSEPLAIEAAKPGARRNTLDSSDAPPPPYSAGNLLSPPLSAGAGPSRAASTGSNWSAAAKGKGPAPPPPKPKPARLAAAPVVETATALYDYEAQAEGDLSFSAGEVIEIVTKTQNQNEWWTGKINGREGVFPGNYVQLN
ncbi:reduced viability upon starvation protein-like protein [Trichodelitschia bisporula]|uniref:Reduced viability upon starvation protein-like protein n=1 Tax=Trichodelitschia bisporula TaxID=703511 RepID=A0A6G1HPP6_9PEZI|nr:reduced viability upon starvation protein-like protein [Trichodelitschia bisporula]